MSGTNKALSSDRSNWKEIQERTFTNWFNDRLRGHLREAPKQIQSLKTDLVDGLLLIELLEKLAAPKTVGRYTKTPRQKVQMIENLGTSLQFIHNENIKLVNIGPEDIHGENLKLILGLIWTLIKAYQIKSTGKGISTKKAMVTWINSIIPEYTITNFSTDWNDGRSVCGLVDHIRPGACPNHQALDSSNGLENCRLGMDLAERMLGIPKVLDPEDMNNPKVDELSVMTYVSYFCNPSNALLLDWIRKKIPENIKNLSTDWNNGINLGALGESCFPGLCPNWKEMEPTNAIENNNLLLGLIKERLGLECPISAAELADPKVDELIVAMYLSQFRSAKLQASPEEFGLRAPNLPTGSALVKEPVTFDIELTEQTANLKDDIRVTAHGPSADVKVNLKPKGKHNLEAVIIPTEPGCYDIVAIYQEENITGSPFMLPVADPSRCAIFGDIPSDMQLGKEEMFMVKARDAGVAKLTCMLDTNEDPVKSSPILTSEVTDLENQQFEVKLVPNEIGHTKIHIKWANEDIPRTPFDVSICDASKVSVSGTKEEGKVGEPVTFQVTADEAECGQGLLKVMPRGSSANYTPEVSKKEGRIYDIGFVPWEVGPHKIDVEYGGGAVPGSPFSLNVTSTPDAKTCSVSGKGLKKAVAGEKTSFQILSPESGLLTKKTPVGLEVVIASSDDTASTEIQDNNDGSYTVNYTAQNPGSYNISIKFYEKHIPGSPFHLNVVPSANAALCKAYGPALHPNSLHIAGNPLDMFVDTTKAGMGDLRVIIIGPDDVKPKVYIANENGIYSMKWDVLEPGRYNIHVWWAEEYISGSPFKIRVSPGPNAAMVRAYGPGLEPVFEVGTDSSEFTIETKDAGIGTLSIRVHGVKGAFKIQAQPASDDDLRTLKAVYHPKEPGDYIIAIRWSGTHVPGSPFKVNIQNPPKPLEKSKAQPPNIYMSYQGESQMNGVKAIKEEVDGNNTPEPTPLSKVAAKKKSNLKSRSQVQIIESKPSSKSTTSLPYDQPTKSEGLSEDEAISEQQRALLQQRRVIPGAVPGTTLVGRVTQTQVVTQTRKMKTTKSLSTSDMMKEKKKKKKKF